MRRFENGVLKFGQQYANQLRRKRPYIADRWHLDEVVVTIKRQQYYLWRAVDAVLLQKSVQN
jgi:putative transposase